jgi:hypothetical protein
MSNNRPPILRMPAALGGAAAAVPPPPSNPPGAQGSQTPQLPPRFVALLDKYPLPWVVGPRGDIWVSADVETFDPDKVASHEKVPGPNGTFWRTTKECISTIGRPRLVAETSEMVDTDRDMSAFIVFAANKLAR